MPVLPLWMREVRRVQLFLPTRTFRGGRFVDPLTYNPNEPQWSQTASWTCSACSLAWLNRALFIDHATDEWEAVDYIGNPEHINSAFGLMDGSGARLAQCLREQGAPAFNFWSDWYTAFELAARMPLLVGGVGWYHWVGVRGVENEYMLLANSAPGWMGIDQRLFEGDWNGLGPFAVVAVPLLHEFPPSPTV